MSDSTDLVPTLPGRCYTDPGIYAAEQAAIFGAQWVYLARADEIPRPGDVLRRHLAGEDLLVVRGDDGEVRTLHNVCRHRGAAVCLEPGRLSRLRCPYHGWTYHLDGRFAGAPNWRPPSAAARAQQGLVPVPTAAWAGLVWVNLGEPGALADQLDPQLAYRFGGAADRIDRYGLADLAVGRHERYEVPANWKLIAENFQECYHCSTIHPELVEQIPSFRSLRTLDPGYLPDGYAFSPDRPSFSLSGSAGLPLLPGLAEADGGRYFGMVLRPNCFVSLLPDHAIVHRVEPTSPTTTTVVCDWLFAPEVVADDRVDLRDTTEIFHRVNLQDFEAAAWCQPNMGSRAYRAGGGLVPVEVETIGDQFHAWYRRHLSTTPEGRQALAQGGTPVEV